MLIHNQGSFPSAFSHIAWSKKARLGQRSSKGFVIWRLRISACIDFPKFKKINILAERLSPVA